MAIYISKTIKDIQWTLISITISSAFHFILRILLGNKLGSSGLGLYTLSFTIYMFGMQFAAFGIGAALTRYVAESNDNEDLINKYTTSGVFGATISGLIMGILVYISAPYLSNYFFNIPELEILIKISAISFPFISIHKVVIGLLNGHRRMKDYAMFQITLNSLTLLTTILLVSLLGYGIKGAIYGYVFPSVIIGIICYFYLLIKYHFRYNKHIFTLYSFGIFVVLTNSIAIINTQIDSILLGRLMNTSEVGIYAVSVLLIQILSLLPSALQIVSGPIVSSLYGKKDYVAIKNKVKKISKYAIIISYIIVLFLIVFGKNIILFVFSTEYSRAYEPMIILGIGYAIYSSKQSIGASLGNLGKIRVNFILTMISATLNTILNILLIPHYGIKGAAIATSISIIIISILYHYLLYKTLTNMI